MDIIELFRSWGTTLGANDWLIPVYVDVLFVGVIAEVVAIIKTRELGSKQS